MKLIDLANMMDGDSKQFFPIGRSNQDPSLQNLAGSVSWCRRQNRGLQVQSSSSFRRAVVQPGLPVGRQCAPIPGQRDSRVTDRPL